jgi:hypothetical protein
MQAIDRGHWATSCLIEILRWADIGHAGCAKLTEVCLRVIAADLHMSVWRWMEHSESKETRIRTKSE